MTQTPQSLQDDLAYMRALVSQGDGVQRSFGQAYFAAGACYVGQLVLTGAQAVGWLPSGPPWGLAVGFGPTLVFLVILTWVLWRARQAPPTGLVGRAIARVFGAVGLANLALVLVIGAVAWRERSLTTWLIYPCCVFVMQAMAWLVAWGLRRRTWQALVALGWVVTAVAMAWFVETPLLYAACAGFGLFAFMTVPGAVLMRQSSRAD